MKELLAHLAGDYVFQTDHMANCKTKSKKVALLHGAEYAACFLPLTRSWKALAVIGATHAVLDHYRLARPLVWATNQAAPKEWRYAYEDATWTGYKETTPDWLAGWLLFIQDNWVHMTINHLALERWGGHRS